LVPLRFLDPFVIGLFSAGIAKVVLKKGKDETFQVWKSNVYSEAVNRINGRPPPKTGDFVLVADGTEKPIGWGLYNSVSMFCVRLMQLEEEATRYLYKDSFLV
jgi:23S rRNA G2069 N7-methylase RlmK/C1962 C5-methylase RlmI